MVETSQFNQTTNQAASPQIQPGLQSKSLLNTSFQDRASKRAVAVAAAVSATRGGNQIKVGSTVVAVSSPKHRHSSTIDQESYVGSNRQGGLNLQSPMSKNDSEASRALRKLKLNNSSKMLVQD